MMKRHPSPRKFSLFQKLIGSYAVIIFFSMGAIIFSTGGLYSLNKIVKDIAKNDLAYITSTSKLRDSINAQDGYAAKYSILKSHEFAELFQRRRVEFQEILRKIQHNAPPERILPIVRSYQEFTARADLLFSGEVGQYQNARAAAENVRRSIEQFYIVQQKLLSDKLEKADQKQNLTSQWSLVISFGGFFLSMCVIAVFLYNVASSLKRLRRATLRIAEGEFDYDPHISPGDEIGDLAHDFTTMAAKLKILEQLSLDASPLTRLPGNIAIEKVLNKKLEEDHPFAVCYADLDNFKAYNDRYGYIKGSEVIKMTGEIIYDAVKCHSDRDAFVGHVGGDDFVMVIPADDVKKVCTTVIDTFTEKIREHYNQEDLAKGAIEGTDRYGVKRVFPIMTISIAVLICQKGEYDSAVKIAHAAVQIKEYAKESSGSNYIINRRRKER